MTTEQLRKQMRSANLDPQPLLGKHRSSLSADQMRRQLAGTLSLKALRQALPSGQGISRMPRDQVVEQLLEKPHLLDAKLSSE